MSERNRGKKRVVLQSNKQVFSSQEVIDWLGISRQTFEYLREHDDHFIVYRVGRNLRMDKTDLDRWIRRQKEVEQAEQGKDLSVIA